MAFLSRDVFAARREAMRGFMEDNYLQAIAFLTPDYFFFATNYFLDVAPWERPVIVVVPKDGEPFAVLHELSTNHVRMAKEAGTLWVDDVTLYSEHPRLGNRLYLTPQWPRLVAEQLRAHNLPHGRIAVDSAGAAAGVTRLLPGIEWLPMEKALRNLRMVKHAEELDLIRQAAELSDFGQARFRENVRPGRIVQEMDFATVAQVMEEAARRFPGQNVEVRCHSLAGPDSAAPHGTGAPTGRRVEAGEGIVNVLIVRLNGLVVENERTWFCGRPTDTQANAFRAATDAQAAAIAQMVAGNPLAAVDAAALSIFEQRGYGDRVIHRTGHGIGIAGHEFPDDMAFNLRPLRAGEVYSAEPGIYIYGLGGFRHDDTVIVGDRPEVVTQTPKDIEHQTIAV